MFCQPYVSGIGRNRPPHDYCWFAVLAGALELLQGVQGFEEVARDSGAAVGGELSL